MEVRERLKRSDTIVRLARSARRLATFIATVFTRKQRIRRYLVSNEVRKLQLGAGPTVLPGWLSTDVAPASFRILYLDATRPFPLDDDTIDYIYSEHMIEHVSWHEGLRMLRECRRVLRPGGAIRVATPDLGVLVDLYNHPDKPVNDRYVAWITERSLPGLGARKTSFVVNNAFHAWGHQFLYDGELMELALREAGFTDVQRCSFGVSSDAHLEGIESHGRNVSDDDMAIFETMIYEARCPRAAGHLR